MKLAHAINTAFSFLAAALAGYAVLRIGWAVGGDTAAALSQIIAIVVFFWTLGLGIYAVVAADRKDIARRFPKAGPDTP